MGSSTGILDAITVQVANEVRQAAFVQICRAIIIGIAIPIVRNAVTVGVHRHMQPIVIDAGVDGVVHLRGGYISVRRPRFDGIGNCIAVGIEIEIVERAAGIRIDRIEFIAIVDGIRQAVPVKIVAGRQFRRGHVIPAPVTIGIDGGILTAFDQVGNSIIVGIQIQTVRYAIAVGILPAHHEGGVGKAEIAAGRSDFTRRNHDPVDRPFENEMDLNRGITRKLGSGAHLIDDRPVLVEGQIAPQNELLGPHLVELSIAVGLDLQEFHRVQIEDRRPEIRNRGGKFEGERLESSGIEPPFHDVDPVELRHSDGPVGLADGQTTLLEFEGLRIALAPAVERNGNRILDIIRYSVVVVIQIDGIRNAVAIAVGCLQDGIRTLIPGSRNCRRRPEDMGP